MAKPKTRPGITPNKVHLDIGGGQGSDRLPLNSAGNLQDPQFTNLPVPYISGENTELKTWAVVQELGIGIEVAWSALIQGPYVAKLSVGLNGDELAVLRFPPQEGHAELIVLNWHHLMLEKLVDPDDEP